MNHLNHHHLYIFWVFARSSSFTKTAQELFIAQSAITKQLKMLEESLGVSLIDRSNRRKPEITSEGRKVLEFADLIFNTSRELLNWSSGAKTSREQTIRVGALSGLSRNLQYEFIKPYIGNSDFKFEVTTGDQKNLLSKLINHELDVLLTSSSINEFQKSKLYVNVLTSSKLIFVSSKKSTHKKRKKIEDILDGVDLYLPGRQFEAKPEIDAYLERRKAKYRLAGEIDDIALLRILALRSDAVVAMPAMGLKGDIEAGNVKVLFSVDDIQQRFYAITQHRLSPNDEIKSLIESLRKVRLKGF